ncbi:MAG: hypothetical protein ACJAQX_001188 [Polaribacter sp.]
MIDFKIQKAKIEDLQIYLNFISDALTQI